jgi:hypothetical protein
MPGNRTFEKYLLLFVTVAVAIIGAALFISGIKDSNSGLIVLGIFLLLGGVGFAVLTLKYDSS